MVSPAAFAAIRTVLVLAFLHPTICDNLFPFMPKHFPSFEKFVTLVLSTFHILYGSLIPYFYYLFNIFFKPGIDCALL